MSESMPIMANAAGLGQSKEALSSGAPDSASASGDFTELLDTQLQLAEDDVSAFPNELLNISDDTELLTALPAPGNDLPPAMVSPQQAAMMPLESIQPQNSAVAGLQASRQTPVAMQAAGVENIGDGTKAAMSVANADNAANMDEMLMTRQQQHMLQAAANSKENSPFDSALNQQLNSEASGQTLSSPSPSGHNMLNMAGLSAGMVTKADAMPGLTPAPVNVPPQHPGWNQSVGERLQWMVGQNLQSADIRLDPPELGSMEARIQIHKDNSASIVFSAPNQQVRDALESAIPRLREMMSDIGLSLGDVNVSQESFTQKQQGDDSSAATGQVMKEADNSEIEGLEGIAAVTPRRGQGILDAYA